MQTSYEIDPVHSNVEFVVRHMMLTNVRGAFTSVTGTVVYDPDNLAASSIHAVIDVNSISTHDEKRDGHLKSADFFDAATYPTITFDSKKVVAKSSDEFTITGDLTMHGVTKEVTLEAQGPAPEQKDPWGNTKTGASAKGKVNRVDFGLKWNAALDTGGIMIGEDVKLEFEIQLVKAKSAAA